ncbi:NAD(P)/FAD-dependent oxidoreductase [Marinobacterium stanieri]|uniref:NAD(P)/FAD-dependent oxidoreductase n=1 Tax=Marinobacterium stanieri TaxID=49186 RepID=UPI00031460AC|nr:FAD-binding oxidoreductase [Marinobacterium stanieri]
MKLAATEPLKRCHWMNQIEPEVRPENVLQGELETDVAIIGGGFVGLWTALQIKQLEPDTRVIVLEQDVCGGGASGRNGGFVMSWWPKIQSLRAFCSDEEALFLCHAAEQAVSEIGEFCRQHEVDADFCQQGWLWTATCEAHKGAWEGTLNACAAMGVYPFERVEKGDLAKRTGSSLHIAGVLEKNNATVQPAKLVRGMRRVAIAQGIEIREGSAVEEIIPGKTVTLKTASGHVCANSAVLATNAWAAQLSEIRRLVANVNSSIVVTENVSTKLDSLGWTEGEAITDSQLLVDYYRKSADGRIVFGKGTGAITYGSHIGSVFSSHAESIEKTEADFRRTYAGLGPVTLTDQWSGPIDRTYDSLPVFGRVSGESNIFYGVGWSGNGVGPSRIGGKILASLALGRQDEWSNCALVSRRCKTFPPEPFRYVGGSMVRNAVMRKEAAELEGRRASFTDVMLAKLAPSGLEDKS